MHLHLRKLFHHNCTIANIRGREERVNTEKENQRGKRKGIVAFAKFRKVVSKIPVKCAYKVKLLLNMH